VFGALPLQLCLARYPTITPNSCITMPKPKKHTAGKCACSLVVSRDKAWLDLLDSTAKACLPVGFANDVHKAARELNLSWCGANIHTKGK